MYYFGKLTDRTKRHYKAFKKPDSEIIFYNISLFMLPKTKLDFGMRGANDNGLPKNAA